MANAKRRRRKNGNRAGRMCITCIVFVFAIVMSTQIIKVYQKDQEYIAKQADLEQQLSAEQDRQKELEAYETYTKSQQYVEDVAKSKLGLLYDNEVVFKEQSNDRIRWIVSVIDKKWDCFLYSPIFVLQCQP